MGFFTKTKVEDKSQGTELFICPSCGNSVSAMTAICSCGQNVEDKGLISWDAINLNEAICIAKRNKLKPSRVKGTKDDIAITDGRDPKFETIDWDAFKRILNINNQKVWYNESQNELRILGPHEEIRHTRNEMRKDTHDTVDINQLEKNSNIAGLNESLNHPDPLVRANVILALIRLAKKGVHSPSSIPLLEVLTKDPDREVRDIAQDAFNIIRKFSGPMVEERVCRECGVFLEPGQTVCFICETPIIAPVAKENLSRAVKMLIPEFLDIGATGEMTFEFDNVMDKDLENISVDFTHMANFFDIQNEVTIPILASGMSVRSRVRFKCKFEEGVFPVRICIICGNTSIDKQFKVKVGGTEIY